MTPLAKPFLELIWQKPTLRRGAIICVVLALVGSGAEIAVALSLVPILASLGVGAGSALAGFVERLPPAGWLTFFALAAVSRSVVNWLSSVQDERGTQDLIVSLQSRLYRALASAHWDVVRRLAPPAISSALHTQTYEAAYGFSHMIQAIAATLLVIGYMLSAAVVFPLVLLVTSVVMAIMWRLNARRTSQVLAHSENYVDAQTDLHQRYEDWVAISRISSLGVDTGKLTDRFETGAREAASFSVSYSRSAAATQISYQFAVVATILLGVPVAWWLETPPAILAFGLLAFIRIIPRVGGIQTGYQGLVSAVAPLRAIERLTEELERDAVPPSTAEPLIDWQHLELSEVGVEGAVGDIERRRILRNVSLELKHGEWLALTGPTGAGKTTLAEVMLALVRPNVGEMRIDGKIVNDRLASRWRDQAAYVPQDVVLFDATIRDNLKLYVPDACDAELEAALSKAAAGFVMERLPDGLDTRAGPGGRWLSGGERQRIGIARALLRKPGLLVLDEPTAALDSDTQEKLMNALAGLEHTMSVVLITHRPELLQLADRIIGIDDGVITRRDDGFRRSDPGPRRP